MKLAIILTLLAFASCSSYNKMSSKNKKEKMQFSPQYTPGPQALIYKTNKDYYNLVPVLLSDDKTEIISYPNPSDLIVGNGYLLPTRLNNDYLLDNRGIGVNVAFLKLTYKEYSQLTEAPSLKELYGFILDKYPLQELCNCGNKNVFVDIEKQLNIIIDKNQIRKTCTILK